MSGGLESYLLEFPITAKSGWEDYNMLMLSKLRTLD